MDIHINQQNQITVVSIFGDVDPVSSEKLSEAFKTQLSKGKYSIVADMHDVVCMSSRGFRSLLDTMKEARQNGGDLHLSGGRGKVSRVFQGSGLGKFIKYFQDVESAISEFTA